VIPVINRLLDARGLFDLAVATQDWHPPDHGSFAPNHGRRPGEVIDLDGIEQILWPVHCVQKTRGAELHAALRRDRFARVFYKGTDPRVDSYSAFFDNRRRHSTGLGEFLRAQRVGEVVLAGLTTDYCVKYSSLDARSLGFDTTVVIDACRGVELRPGDVERAIEEMKAAGVRLVESAETLGFAAKRSAPPS
jgi:nicotinamidase/pyrazinamidase